MLENHRGRPVLAASLLIAVGATIGWRMWSLSGSKPADEQQLAHGKTGNDGVKPTVPQPNSAAATNNQIATTSDGSTERFAR